MDFNKINTHYKKVSYQKKPDNLNLEEWQYALRKKFAETHHFKIEKTGEGIVYTDYNVYNPETHNTYKVAIRSADNTANFCECNDFKTNGLGTCKHIEATFFHIIKIMQKGNLLNMEYRPFYTSVYLDYRAGRKVKIRIGTEKEKEFAQLAHEYFNEDGQLKESAIGQFEDILKKAHNIEPGFRCYPDALEHIITLRERAKRKELVSQKYLKNRENGVFKSLIKAELFPYQKDGVLFASATGRCIIADDMGLGKTIQAIAAANLLKKEKYIEKILVICPTSLKYQWQKEIEKFTDEEALVIEGVVTKREQQYQFGNYGHFFKIVSYNTAVNDIGYINEQNFDLVILDEAQRIKNFNTKISRNIKKIKSSLAFVLTGTPLENKLEELYSIVQFIDPFALGPFYQFMHQHQMKNETGKVVGYKDLNAIGQMLQGIMIRRKKKDVLLELPDRMDKILQVPMTAKQREIHDSYANNVAQIVNKWKRQGFLREKDRQNLMIFLNMMRMACNSTYIIDQETRHDTKIDELLGIIEEMMAEGDEKIVVFSQWERMTRIVAGELEERNIGYEHLNGSVPSAQRAKLFENFNNDPDCRVFLSTDAGGVGLNLQAASILVNLDIPWNPAVLEQRIARIYRLGQTRKVSIINMVSIDTIEHRMLGVISFKKGLSEGIIDQGENTIFMGDSKFNKFMETVEGVAGHDGQGERISQQEEEESQFEKPEPILPAAQETPTSKPKAENGPFVQGALFGDDDIVQPKTVSVKREEAPAAVPAHEVIDMGAQFFSHLGKILSDTEKTDQLLKSIVKKDPQNGKTYMQIPVEDDQMVANLVTVLKKLLVK
jgi:hypothetical protein